MFGVMVFHLHRDLGRAEEAVFVPCDRTVGVDEVAVCVEWQPGIDLPVVQQVVIVRAVLIKPLLADVFGGHGVLDVAHLEVVLFVPDVVHGGQADVFVRAAIAGNVMVTHRGQQQVAHGVTDSRIHGDEIRASLHRGLDAEVAEIHPQGQRAGACHRHGGCARAHDAGRYGQENRCAVEPEIKTRTHGLRRRREGGDVRIERRTGFGIQRIRKMRRIKARVRVEQQRLARELAIDHLAAGVANTQVGDIVPGDVGAAGFEKVLAQLVQRGQGGVGRFTEGVLPGHRCAAVDQMGAGVV
jgi:hypothetical protein